MPGRRPRTLPWLKVAVINVRKNAFWLIVVLTGTLLLAHPARASEKQAPDLSIHDMNGKVWTLSSLRGKWVLLNFWATWCGPCIKEMPALERFSQSPTGKKLVILAISESLASHQKVVRFLDKLHITYTVLNDPFGEVADSYHVRALPTSALVSPDGKLMWVVLGAIPFDDPAFSKDYLPKALVHGGSR